MDAAFVFAITVAMLIAAVLRSGGWAKLIETLADEMNNNFRGGPPTPMHPSPVNDAPLLRRRAPKVEREHFRR